MNNLESNLACLIEFLKEQNVFFKLNERMEKYSTILIGGEGRIVLFPNSIEQFLSVHRFLQEKRLKSFVFSGGSNTLFSLDKNDSVIICTKCLRGIKIEKDKLTAFSGERLGNLIKVATENGLSGLEYYVGVPAALGGALYMNFSCYERQICELVESVLVLKNGECFCLNRGQINYSYRNGGFNAGEVILAATLKLKSKDIKEIVKTKSCCYKKRKSSQPLNALSLGCVFKNTDSLSAGKLIDELGLKGLSVGGAAISPKHGAFIVNYAKATANDVLNLIDKTREIVYNKVKIELETEIVILH